MRRQRAGKALHAQNTSIQNLISSKEVLRCVTQYSEDESLSVQLYCYDRNKKEVHADADDL